MMSLGDYTNYANVTNYNTVSEANVEPLGVIALKYNGIDRFNRINAKYFRLVTPYEHHTSSPDDYVYLYSFAENPESGQPSGTCNFSHIDNIHFNITLTSSILAGTLAILAVNYNVLRIMNGMSGLMYS